MARKRGSCLRKSLYRIIKNGSNKSPDGYVWTPIWQMSMYMGYALNVFRNFVLLHFNLRKQWLHFFCWMSVYALSSCNVVISIQVGLFQKTTSTLFFCEGEKKWRQPPFHSCFVEYVLVKWDLEWNLASFLLPPTFIINTEEKKLAKNCSKINSGMLIVCHFSLQV